MKRTMKGIHLLNHSENGVEIQFYTLMITAVLMMKLKQDCQEIGELEEKEEKAEKKEENTLNPSEWIKDIGRIF